MATSGSASNAVFSAASFRNFSGELTFARRQPTHHGRFLSLRHLNKLRRLALQLISRELTRKSFAAL